MFQSPRWGKVEFSHALSQSFSFSWSHLHAQVAIPDRTLTTEATLPAPAQLTGAPRAPLRTALTLGCRRSTPQAG